MVGMKLSDLDQDERLALVALMRGIVLADGDVSEPEAEVLPGLADELAQNPRRVPHLPRLAPRGEASLRHTRS
jgi:uncharacterized tellurite resistance protein B-like protein